MLCVFVFFTSISKLKVDVKSINMFARDYSKFLSEKFRNDVFSINFYNDLEDVNDPFLDFYQKLERCVDLNAPMKKPKPKEILLKTKTLDIPLITEDD